MSSVNPPTLPESAEPGDSARHSGSSAAAASASDSGSGSAPGYGSAGGAGESLGWIRDVLEDRDVAEMLERHAQAEEAAGELQQGRRLGEFRLLQRFGRGAMGEVWEAHQESLDRVVALKVLRQDAASRRARALFEQEARAMARLRHPGIVTVHATGATDGRLWIAQELVEGRRTFADQLEAQRRAEAAGEDLPTDFERRTVGFFLGLARAIAYAHGQGVVHRDLKPANVLVEPSGTPRITDFGLAVLRDEVARSNERTITGTPCYMSPEQVAGQVYGLDERTDVFSIGIMLYEALTLARPFDSELEDEHLARREIFERIATHQPEAPNHPRLRLSQKLQALCQRCLEKERSKRYSSAHDLADDLQRFLDGRPLQSAERPAPVAAKDRTDPAYNVLTGHPGQFLGPFRLVRYLDKGSQGEVWEAFDTKFERRVALKIVDVKLRTEAQLQRFRREGMANAQFAHRSIVQVYESGFSQGYAWIAMELVEGSRTLRQQIEEEFGRLGEAATAAAGTPHPPSSQAVLCRKARFFAELAEALEVVHQQRMVHRDVKPSNILIGADGHGRISDFGTVRLLDEVGRTETQEAAVGTPWYQSPEQLNSRVYELDGRSDVFCLGICLYEALCGLHPFEADTPKLVQQKILEEHPLRLSRVMTRLPIDLETIVAKALRRSRDERYRTMADFAADLRAFAEGRPISARAPARSRQALRWVRANRATVAAGATLLATLLTLEGGRAIFAGARPLSGPATVDLVSQVLAESRNGLVDLEQKLGTLLRLDRWPAPEERLAVESAIARVERSLPMLEALATPAAVDLAADVRRLLDGTADLAGGSGLRRLWLARLESAPTGQ
jgi:serine/threonine protein kinase